MTHHSWLFCLGVGVAATIATLILLVVVILVIWAISKVIGAFYDKVFGVYDTDGHVIATWILAIIIAFFTLLCRFPDAAK